jgi:hypothetical protein
LIDSEEEHEAPDFSKERCSERALKREWSFDKGGLPNYERKV